MLVTAQHKISERRWKSPLFEADALRLPLKNESVDAITIAFGFRNLANYQTGLLELARVLKPGGMLLILEFSHPQGLLMKTSYGLYSRWIMPTLGAMISGSRGAYTYLPESIKKFPTADMLREMMDAASFTETGFELLTGGIAALHTGTKSQDCVRPLNIVPQVHISNQSKQIVGMKAEQFGGLFVVAFALGKSFNDDAPFHLVNLNHDSRYPCRWKHQRSTIPVGSQADLREESSQTCRVRRRAPLRSATRGRYRASCNG